MNPQLSKSEKINAIESKIQELGYHVQEVQDHSYKHQGHQGFSDTGSHFHVIMKAKFSSTMEKIKIQKKVMSSFLSLIPQEIHAITIDIQSL